MVKPTTHFRIAQPKMRNFTSGRRLHPLNPSSLHPCTGRWRGNRRCSSCRHALRPDCSRYECKTCKPELNMCHACWSKPSSHLCRSRHAAWHKFVRCIDSKRIAQECPKHDAEFVAEAKACKLAAAGASTRKRSSDSTKKQRTKTSTAGAVVDQCIHVGVTCDNCFTQNMAGVRHRCSECFDFDLCDACFAEHRNAHTHPLSSFMHLSSPVVHINVRCCGCQSQPLVGTRYECTSCKPTLNMCYTCWSTPATHASQSRHTARHSFVRFAVQDGPGVGCDQHDAEFTAEVDKLKRKAQAHK
jgi:hypothetical protein